MRPVGFGVGVGVRVGVDLGVPARAVVTVVDALIGLGDDGGEGADVDAGLDGPAGAAAGAGGAEAGAGFVAGRGLEAADLGLSPVPSKVMASPKVQPSMPDSITRILNMSVARPRQPPLSNTSTRTPVVSQSSEPSVSITVFHAAGGSMHLLPVFTMVTYIPTAPVV